MCIRDSIKRMEKPTDEKCELCGAPLVIKWGKHGSFYACSTYDKENPDTCKFTKENPINLPDLDSADIQAVSYTHLSHKLALFVRPSEISQWDFECKGDFATTSEGKTETATVL